MDHNMVLSYDYSNWDRRQGQTNSPPSRAIFVAMAVQRCNTASIAWWRTSRAYIKATKHHHWATTRSVLPRRPPGWQSTEHLWLWYNAQHLLTIFDGRGGAPVLYVHIAQWRRFMAFLKATKRHHWASTHSDRIKGTLQSHKFAII